MTVVLAAAASSSTSWINLDDLWKIIVLGIICGAGRGGAGWGGRPLFAIGLRLLGLPSGGKGWVPASEDDDRSYFGNVGGAVGAVVCLAIVLGAIALGIYWIVTS